MLLGEQSFVRITLFIAVLSCNWGRENVFSSFGIVIVGGMGVTLGVITFEMGAISFCI